MDEKWIAQEFELLRDKLRQIGSLIISEDYVEAAFMIGCLHSKCNQHYMVFREKVIENVDSKTS